MSMQLCWTFQPPFALGSMILRPFCERVEKFQDNSPSNVMATSVSTSRVALLR